MKNCIPQHDPRTCPMCGPLRHPSKGAMRRALSALPRQSAPAATGRANGTGGGQ